MDFTETQIDSEQKYSGIVVEIHMDTVRLPNGKTSKREVVGHPGGVTILPLDDDGYVYCVRQYRYIFGAHLLETPAGKLERGESPLDCAIRELSEETGATAKQIIPLGEIYPSPGFCSEILSIYLARGLIFNNPHPDEGEFLSIERLHLDVLLEKIASMEVRDGKTIIAALRTKQYLENSQRNLT